MNNEQALIETLLADCDANTLWCADEQTLEYNLSRFTGQIVCNRFRQTNETDNWHFSDFNFSDCNTTSLQKVVFRIAKEKAINHHIIHQAFLHLPESGKLYLAGYKNEGINSLKSNIRKNYACELLSTKHGKQLQLLEITSHGPQDIRLADTPYQNIQTITHDQLTFLSKPGLFGWNKVDRGSAILIEAIKDISFPTTNQLLDLGCGYGYLSLMANQLGIQDIDATDNCAAAVLACQANFEKQEIAGTVTASDCGQQLNKHYDLILCNPPFHQGFDHKKDLTAAFVESAAMHLKPQGTAYFVTNQFIGIESIAEKYFTKTSLLVKKEGFKVVQLNK